MKHCLGPDQFQRLLTEEVSATERTVLEAHIDVCPICQDKLARLLDEGEEPTAYIHLQRLRQSGPEPTPGSMEDFFRGLKERPPPSTATDSEPADGPPRRILFSRIHPRPWAGWAGSIPITSSRNEAGEPSAWFSGL